MTEFITRSAWIVALFLLSGTAFSFGPNQQTCEGKIDSMQIVYQGRVEILSQELYGDHVGRVLCNMVTDWKGVSADACKTWYSIALASMAQRSKIRIQYDPGDTCAGQGSWSTANRPHMVSAAAQ